MKSGIIPFDVSPKGLTPEVIQRLPISKENKQWLYDTGAILELPKDPMKKFFLVPFPEKISLRIGDKIAEEKIAKDAGLVLCHYAPACLIALLVYYANYAEGRTIVACEHETTIKLKDGSWIASEYFVSGCGPYGGKVVTLQATEFGNFYNTAKADFNFNYHLLAEGK